MASPAPPPFEVELHLGGGVVVPFRLYEDHLRAHRNPMIAGIASQGRREAARAAGVAIAENAVTMNLDKPLSVEDGGSLSIIPVGRVQAVRFHDPTIKGERQPFGFSADRLGATGEAAPAG